MGELAISALRFLTESRSSVADIPARPVPGVYALFLKRCDGLPGVNLPPSGLVYIGQSIDLEKRNHFKAKHSGFHTPRRSLGAILKADLRLSAMPRAPGTSPTNYRNYRFTDEGERQLSAWMRSNLEYSIFPFDGNVDRLETQLIEEGQPPLNLTKWSNPQKPTIKALRKICQDEAKLVWQARHRT